MCFQKIGVIFGVLIFCALIVYYGTPQSISEGTSSPVASISPADYSFAVPPEECAVCGERPELAISALWGHENVAFLDLNTFDVLEVPVNRYAPRGPLIEEPALCSTLIRGSLGGASLAFFATPDRGMATGWLEWQTPAPLCPRKAGQFLCEACLLALVPGGQNEGAMPPALAVVSLAEKRIVPLNKAVSLLQIGDFFLHGPQLAETLQTPQIAGRAHLFLCLCPVRYTRPG